MHRSERCPSPYLPQRRWLELWRDLRELQGAGAFELLSKENMLAQLCGALLRGGHFKLARSFLQVPPCLFLRASELYCLRASEPPCHRARVWSQRAILLLKSLNSVSLWASTCLELSHNLSSRR